MLFEGTCLMRKYGLSLLFIIFFIPTLSYADGTLKCGIKPIPEIGCRIGRCVDGMWEQICDTSPTISCGIKPIPDVGCSILLPIKNLLNIC